MSWSLSATDVTPDNIVEKLQAASASSLEAAPYDSWDDDVQAQQDAVFKAAAGLADLVYEGKDHVLNVSASGHARRTETDYVNLGVSFNSAPKPKKK